mgnify:CR=1 FL=1
MFRDNGIMRGVLRGVGNLHGAASSNTADLMENGTLISDIGEGSRMVPPGVTSINIEGWGKGGNGCVNQPGTYNYLGGGAGGYFKLENVSVTPGDIIDFSTGDFTTCEGAIAENGDDAHNVNNTWNAVGSAFTVSTVATTYPCITRLSENRIAYIDANQRLLKTYEFNGSTWSQIGNSLYIADAGSLPRISAMSSTRIAYISPQSDQVRAYDFDGTDWAQVGSAIGVTIPGGSVDIAGLTSSRIALTYAHSAGNTYLSALDFSGSSWSFVGTTIINSGDANSYPSISRVSSDTVLYTDIRSDLLWVLQFNGSGWATVGINYALGTITSGPSRIVSLFSGRAIYFNHISSNPTYLKPLMHDSSVWRACPIGSALRTSGSYDSMCALSKNRIVFCDATARTITVYDALTGLGGLASGGDINEQGGYNNGTRTTNMTYPGGDAYNGGSGGAAVSTTSGTNGNDGSAPGGGGGGGGVNSTVAGAGALGGIKFSW